MAEQNLDEHSIGRACSAPARVLSKKKTFRAIERDSPERQEYRRAFCAMLLLLNLSRLVFIDESFCKTGMRLLYGWSPRGTRSFGKMPVRSWKTVSLVGAIRLNERPRLMTHRGPVNGKVFLRFVRRYLVPSLRKGDIVFMDNLNIHKMKRVRQLIEAAGASAVYLPTYSPELNPIELWWNDLKRSLRKQGIDAEQELRKAAQRERASLSLTKIRNWFGHAMSEARAN